MDRYAFPGEDTDVHRHIVESALDYAIFTTDLDGTVTTWSAGAKNLFGYSPDEMIGQNSAIIFSFEDQLAGVPLKERRVALSEGRARRSGVTNELHIIEGIKAIKATRGNVRIIDRAKLEEIAAGSYGIPEREYERLIGLPIRRSANRKV
ncbi:PAS domain S-box protein [Rhizobium bangladeshense]|nr:PAS domain S-box protein [Rhizobium bangladeshense]